MNVAVGDGRFQNDPARRLGQLETLAGLEVLGEKGPLFLPPALRETRERDLHGQGRG